MSRLLVRLLDGRHFGKRRLTLSWVTTKWEKRDAWIGVFWNRTEYDEGLSVYICPIPFRVIEVHFEPCEVEDVPCEFTFNQYDTGPVEGCIHGKGHLLDGIPHEREDGWTYQPTGDLRG